MRRLMALVVLLQLSGVVHVISELSGTPEVGCNERCADDNESPGDECPPFCPSCTCQHASRPGLVAADSTLGEPMLALTPLLLPWRLGAPPADRAPPRIFHPPRA